MKKYGVILADPPWSYPESGSGNRTISAKYPTMSIDDICKLPVSELTKENALLFMWITFPRLFDCQPVFNAWGFAYHSLGWGWAKLNPSGLGFAYGMGYYTRQNLELCLIGVKGKVRPKTSDVQALIVSCIQEHSRKPDDQYNKIERISDGPYLELFARRPRAGWDVWGNEVNSTIDLEVPA